MRHNKKFNHLSRKSAHRDAMLANMTISLIMHKRVGQHDHLAHHAQAHHHDPRQG